MSPIKPLVRDAALEGVARKPPLDAWRPMRRLYRHSHYWALFWEMTRCDAKLREQGSALGFFWTLLRPLVLFLVMYELFSKWMGHMVPDYGFYLLLGLLQWSFFIDGTGNALRSLQAKGGLIKSFKFPREIVVFSSVAVILWTHLLEIGMLLALLLIFKHATVCWLYLPVLIVLEILWTSAASLFLARWALEIRDLERVWSVLSQASCFVVPVFYPMQIIAASKRFWLMLNPLVHIMDGMRDCLLRGRVPPLWIVASLMAGGVAALTLGLLWFRRNEAAIADLL